MKRETTEQKMLAAMEKWLRDNPEKMEEYQKKHKSAKLQEESRKGKFVSITEDEIQDFRAVQGLIYFLQAPALFQAKVCKHCGEQYLVSRLFVAYCSYTCIEKSLNEMGITWNKGKDIDTLIQDPQIYAGQEPIWIRNLSNLKTALEKLVSLQEESTTKVLQ